MPPVAVVSDSTHYLPADVVTRHGLHTVPLHVTWGADRRTDPETALPDFGGFYDYLRSTAGSPTAQVRTSMPSEGEFLAVYEPLLAEGADIVSIHLSGEISGTVRAAAQARDRLAEQGIDPARIHVLDSRSATAGHGLMAVAAANAARAGAGAAEAAARATALREDMDILFRVDTLEFLRQGGRIGGAAAWIGTALKIKPMLKIEGGLEPVERVRTSARGFERLVEHLERLREGGRDVFFVQHIRAHAEAERLAERGAAIFGRPPGFIAEIGPVIGSHAGPGLLGTTAL